jgi:hypothetical protein
MASKKKDYSKYVDSYGDLSKAYDDIKLITPALSRLSTGSLE